MDVKKVTYEEALARFKRALEIRRAAEKRMEEEFKQMGLNMNKRQLNAELEDIVSQGEKDIAEGNFKPIAIDDLWK